MKKKMDRNYYLLLAGLVTSSLGTQIYDFAVAWYILDTTGKASIMSVYLAMNMLLRVFWGPVIAVHVDRMNKLRLVRKADLTVSVITLGISLMMFSSKSVFFQIAFLFVIGIVITIIGLVYNPSFAILFKNSMSDEQLISGNSIRSLVQNSRIILGAFISGILYSQIGFIGILVLNSITYLASAVIEMFIDDQETHIKSIQSKEKYFKRDFGEGIRYLLSKKDLLNILILFSFFNVFAHALSSVVIPYLFNQVFNSDPTLLSLSRGAFVLGLLVVSYLYINKTTPDKLNGLLKVGMGTNILAELTIIGMILLYINSLLNFKTFLVLFYLLYFAMGFTLKLFQIPFVTMLQKNIENDKFAKVTSIIDSILEISTPIGTILIGFSLDGLGIEATCMILAAGLLVSLVYLQLSKSVRRI